jgi:hypothetical protein
MYDYQIIFTPFDFFGWMLTGLFAALAYIINSWLLGRVFHKAGVARWKAWIPILRTWKFFNIGGRSGASVLLTIAVYCLAILAHNLIVSNSGGHSSLAVMIALFLWIAAFVILIIYIYVAISAAYNIQKKLGKPGAFLILAFINLIAPLWLWVLALDGSKWRDKKGRAMLK